MAFETRTAVIVGAAVVLVAAGIYGLLSLSGESLPPIPSTHAPTVGPLATPDFPEQSSSVPVASNASDARWSADDSLATVATRYRNAKDLREFYDRALAAGGTANLWYALSALTRCTVVSRHGMVGAEQRFSGAASGDEFDAVRREAWREWLEPCRAFELRTVPPGETQRLVTKLRDLPGIVGEGFRMHVRSVTPDERQAYGRSIVESGNGELLHTFASDIPSLVLNLGPADEKEGRASLQRRVLVEHQGWLLATCELGHDCSRGSEQWMTGCVVAGDCSENNVEAMAIKSLGKDALPEVRRRRDMYVAAVKARDWAALGL